VTTKYWYLLSGILLGLMPLLLFVAIKKFDLLDIRPDQKIVYQSNGAQTLTLHVFEARNRTDDSPAPALLLFHGGRWLYGNPEQLYRQCQFFAAQGFTCFSAQYRLAPTTPPDVRGAVADAQSALRYLVEHAAKLHIDAAKITIGGGSAGGHLAAAVGSGLPLTAGAASRPAPHRPAAQILYNPMLDLAPGTPDHHLVKDYWKDISPLHHLNSAVPPTLILLGSQDPEVTVSTAKAFCHGIESVGGRCEIALYEGQSHGFYNHQPYREKTNVRILEFLRALNH